MTTEQDMEVPQEAENALEGAELGQEAEAPQENQDIQEHAEQEEMQEQVAPVNFEAQQEARKYGWRPKEEYTNDPKGWVDADRFLKLPSTEIKRMRDERKAERSAFESRMQNLERMNNIALERQKQAFETQIDDLTLQQRVAVQTADTETYDRLEKQKQSLAQQAQEVQPQQNNGPDPFISQYVAENEWARNPVLWQQAVQMVSANPAAAGATPQQQVAYAEQQIKMMYPAMFQNETPQPQPRRQQPQRVDGGGLAGAKRATLSSKLPPEAKSAAEQFVAQGLFKTVDDYAKAYFEEGN